MDQSELLRELQSALDPNFRIRQNLEHDILVELHQGTPFMKVTFPLSPCEFVCVNPNTKLLREKGLAGMEYRSAYR